MRYLIWPASFGLLLAACGPAQETADTAEEDTLDAAPELVDPVVEDPVDDIGMPPPDMLEEDVGEAMPEDPAMTEDELPEEDDMEPEDPAAPDGG
ncbi:hypothetical protein [Parasphingopyxis sp.]|uniref:hypothetical protein n=1 Tax=Parasphingopyxis sp. TaxID=1920299 RepID=UPI0026096E42|nr:hypothetical protein [Parasphingopyxis sp.]